MKKIKNFFKNISSEYYACVVSIIVCVCLCIFIAKNAKTVGMLDKKSVEIHIEFNNEHYTYETYEYKISSGGVLRFIDIDTNEKVVFNGVYFIKR